jgi:hypothetical protein
MYLIVIVKLAGSFIGIYAASRFLFRNYTRLKEDEQHRLRGLEAICTATNLSIDHVQNFIKTHHMSLEDTMEYAARYGKLPDEATAELIGRYGLSTWRRFIAGRDM